MPTSYPWLQGVPLVPLPIYPLLRLYFVLLKYCAQSFHPLAYMQTTGRMDPPSLQVFHPPPAYSACSNSICE